jgi:hypothetical protein
MMEAVNTSETSANFFETTRYNIAEDSHLHLNTIELMMEAVNTSEKSVKFFETTRYNIAEDCHFHLHIIVTHV